MVQRVQKIAAQLELDPLRDREAFGHRRVPIVRTWSEQHIARRIAPGPRLRSNECGGIEIRPSVNHVVAAPLSRVEIGACHYAGAPTPPTGISDRHGEGNRKRSARLVRSEEHTS